MTDTVEKVARDYRRIMIPLCSRLSAGEAGHDGLDFSGSVQHVDPVGEMGPDFHSADTSSLASMNSSSALLTVSTSSLAKTSLQLSLLVHIAAPVEHRECGH
jgi:hypothetical protein